MLGAGAYLEVFAKLAHFTRLLIDCELQLMVRILRFVFCHVLYLIQLMSDAFQVNFCVFLQLPDLEHLLHPLLTISSSLFFHCLNPSQQVIFEWILRLLFNRLFKSFDVSGVVLQLKVGGLHDRTHLVEQFLGFTLEYF
jgi:hypothetical protein